jgi:hypothetical protein
MFLKFADKDLASVSVQASKDFIIDEWCPGGQKCLFVQVMAAVYNRPPASPANPFLHGVPP